MNEKENVMNDENDVIIHHYDLLIDENNDPVHDPKPMQDYMDQWDGQKFIDQMELNENKSVLEVGVGTGRLALRVIPLCGEFSGIDISPKTIERARKNLAGPGNVMLENAALENMMSGNMRSENVMLMCGEFLEYKFDRFFDVIYSSLTFMHIKDKQRAIDKIAGLLNNTGRFVLSIDKNQSGYIDTGTNKIKVYPDTPKTMAGYIKAAGMKILEQYETEFAVVFVAQKG